MSKKKDHNAFHSVGGGKIHSTLSSARFASKSTSACGLTSKPSGDRILCVGNGGIDAPRHEKAFSEACELPEVCSAAKENLPEKKDVQIAREKKSSNFSSCNSAKTLEGKGNQSDFSEPKLLTSLKIIESLHSLGENCVKNKNSCLEPSVSKKAARKVNIPFEEKVYRDLIALQVNDEDLGVPKIPQKPKEIIRARDPEPVLSDYYKPKFDKEYILKPPPPSIDLSRKIKLPKQPSVYEQTKLWEPDKSNF